MRITKLHLKNIGVFEDEVIEFKEKTNPDKAEIHILTGENGTGKSTILYALAGMRKAYVSKLDDEDIIEKHLLTNLIVKRFIYRNPNESLYEVYLNHNNLREIFSSYLTVNNAPEIEVYLRNSIYYYDGMILFNFNFAFFAYSGYRNVGSYKIQSIQEITENPFENSLDFNKSINPSLLINWIANTKTKESLALAKGDKEKAEKHCRSLSRIEQAISNIIDQKIEFILEYEPFLNVVLKIEDKKLEFDVLPDGLKSIISWIADLLMRMDRIKWATDEDILDRNFILFLDEIEVHLHPAWQRKILPEVQKLFKNAQIFISTHSPFVVGSVEDAWVYKLKLENGNSKVVEVVESNEGLSYKAIVREIFGIDSSFSVEVEQDLAMFRELRNKIIRGESVDLQVFKDLILELSSKGVEVEGVVRRELRQLEKITNQEFALDYE
jgi:predicted ATP-binding protein involved in virulence